MNLLKGRRGSMILLVPVLLIVLLTFFASICEYSRLNSVAANTNDAVQAALTQVCTDNATPVYTGMRDGYSGGYKLESTNWTPDVSSSDILSKVDAKLGTSGGVKTNDGKLIYKITGLSVTMKNAPLAPSDPDGAEQLTGTASYTLTVPLSFGWSALPPMTIHMEAKSGYSQQGDLRGSDDSGGDSGTQVTGVSLSESAMTLCKGDTDVLAASVLPDDAEDRSVSWASADSAVCSVTQSGVITGVNKGETSVLAISGSGKMAQCDVTVVLPVTGVSLDKSKINMIPGATESLTATVSPSDATNRGVSWVSSDPSVCTVSDSGKVTAVGAGQSTITVMTQEGGYYAECVVEVTIPVTGITMDKTSIYLIPGATDTLAATVWPENATQRDVLWASSDSSVCSVDPSGHIAGIKTGSAVISATTKDGQHVATCIVQVGVPVTGVTLDSAALTMAKGTSKTLNATVIPSNATDKAVTWSSSNTAVAAVDDTGTVTAIGVGSATITVKTHDGGYTATCNVTVVIPVTGVTLDHTELQIVKGNTAKLTATITPPDATDQEVTWFTSDSSVAAVDKSGNVTAVDGGTATITVRTHDGGFTASCKVAVFVPVTGISLDPTVLVMRKSDTAQLTATITPANVTDKGVTWASSNTSVCTVDNSGKVTAIHGGKAIITVTTDNGHFQATCEITVSVPVTGISLSAASMYIARGDTKTLKANIIPTDATDQSVTWRSSDTSVATVNSNGQVTGIKLGKTVITATTHDGGFSASCTVTVCPKVQAYIYDENTDGYNSVASDGSSGRIDLAHNYKTKSDRHAKTKSVTIDFVLDQPITVKKYGPIIGISEQNYKDEHCVGLVHFAVNSIGGGRSRTLGSGTSSGVTANIDYTFSHIRLTISASLKSRFRDEGCVYFTWGSGDLEIGGQPVISTN